ncbi:hypothetical protein [Halovenus salina]|uniref:Uncharacterized protein n=1 Tax=Halovenus salina TaxID=1510225 RepID=A0ABD5W447_9EURY
MEIEYTETTDLIEQEGNAIASASGVEGLAIFAAPADSLDPSVEPFLQTLDIPVFGGIFPELIFRGEKGDRCRHLWTGNGTERDNGARPEHR